MSQQEEMKQSANVVQEKISKDQTALDEQRVELQGHMEQGQQLVYGFLQEELQQDVPTGNTVTLLLQPRDYLGLYLFNYYISTNAADSAVDIVATGCLRTL